MWGKTFSLEGGESIIPALDTLIEKAAEMGVEQFVMGMAHQTVFEYIGKTYFKIYSRYFRRV
jgi:2-oxoglutarate dehydrogenase complex dehydrogenase (E1) component-like enzyme